jgi:hypothetical protein
MSFCRPQMSRLKLQHLLMRICSGPCGGGKSHQSRQKSLNRFGASAVYTAVLVIDGWPSRPRIARVSCLCWPERGRRLAIACGGCGLSSRPGPAAARSIIRAKPAAVNGGVPSLLSKTEGGDGLSR